MNQPVRLKDIAAAAGVTTATVSMALSRSPRISEATRERVVREAARLGYRRDPYVSALMTRRRERFASAASKSRPVIAFCTAIDATATGGPADRAARVPFESAVKRSAERGCRVERFDLLAEGMTGKRASEILYARNVAGAILYAVPELRTISALEFVRFPVVSLGFATDRPMVNRVACDYFQSMTLALERCRLGGYKRIGLALSDDENPRVNRRWLAAYLVESTRGRRREDPDLPPLVLDRWDEDAFFAWLDRGRPDVVISPWGKFLRGRLKAKGWPSPERIGLVSLADSEPDSGVTGVFRNPGLLAARAVDMLIGAIERNETGLPKFPATLFVRGAWSPGETLIEGDGPEEGMISPVSTEAEKPATSMREIAARLGVHVSTVSLSLRGSPKIPEATRGKVVAAAEEFGYRRNPYISALMKGKRAGRYPRERPRLAFVTAFPTRDGWRREIPTVALYFRAAHARAREKGFRLEEEWLPPDGAAREEFSDRLRESGVQGLMFASPPAENVSIPVKWDDFSLVAVGISSGLPSIHRVSNDYYSSMRRVVRECHRLGYRRIGLAMRSPHNRELKNLWLAAYLMQQRELADLAAVEPLMLDEWNDAVVFAWVKEARPDAIIAAHPHPLAQWIASGRYAGFGDIGFASLTYRGRASRISGIYQNVDLLGAHATDLLIGLIERNEFGIPGQPNTLMVDGIWVPGRTVRTRR